MAGPTFVAIGIDGVDDFRPPYGSGTKDCLINLPNRMLRFPPGNPPPKGTTYSFTFIGLRPSNVFKTDSAKTTREGIKGTLLNMTGVPNSQAQQILNNNFFNPEQMTSAMQSEFEPDDEHPQILRDPPVIPQVGTPIVPKIPAIPQIAKTPFPRPGGGGNPPQQDSPREKEDSKDAKGKHSSLIKTGVQDMHSIVEIMTRMDKKYNALMRHQTGDTGEPPGLDSSSLVVPDLISP